MRGRALVTPAGEIEILTGENPLDPYAPTATDLREIARLAQCSNAGDIILFGAYDRERDECICFDDQVGAHGALGGRQAWPFLMTAPGLVPDGYEIDDPLDLHPLLERYSAPSRASSTRAEADTFADSR
jgi:hypothetical protein